MFRFCLKADVDETQQSARGNVISKEMSEDQKLMRASAGGDVKAFQKLYEKFKGPLMSYIGTIVRGQAVVEDLTQEVFLRAYRSRENYTASAKFSTWLWTIARNCAFDYLRAAKHKE